MSLTTTASSPLSRSLPRPYVDRARSVLGGEPHERLPGRRRAANVREHVWGRFELQTQMLAVGLLELAVRGLGGAEVSDGGGHQQHVASGKLPLARLARAGRPWRPLARRRPRGGAATTLAAITVTSAPRARAAWASASPMRPEEPLPMKRTLSIGSRVPPAVTSTRSPPPRASRGRRRSRSRGRCSGEQRLADLQQPRGVGQAPHPLLALGGEAAAVGLDHVHAPRAQRVEVGPHGGVLVHVVVHRRRHHERARGGERGAAVRRLSARPPASLAIVLAEAGAIR